MVYIDIHRSNTHADPLLGSRWAQMWVHMWAHTLVILLVYVTKDNICDKNKTGSKSSRIWGMADIRSVKNTLPTKLHWILFPIEDFRQAVDTAKEYLPKRI